MNPSTSSIAVVFCPHHRIQDKCEKAPPWQSCMNYTYLRVSSPVLWSSSSFLGYNNGSSAGLPPLLAFVCSFPKQQGFTIDAILRVSQVSSRTRSVPYKRFSKVQGRVQIPPCTTNLALPRIWRSPMSYDSRTLWVDVHCIMTVHIYS